MELEKNEEPLIDGLTYFSDCLKYVSRHSKVNTAKPNICMSLIIFVIIFFLPLNKMDDRFVFYIRSEIALKTHAATRAVKAHKRSHFLCDFVKNLSVDK